MIRALLGLACAVLLGLALLAPHTAVADDVVRIGVFVGNNVGYGSDETLRAAEREARDMASAFQQLGDLRKERAYVITGQDAGHLVDRFRTIDGQIREAQARGSKVLLLFFYSGHATADGLRMRGTLLPMAQLRRWLESSPADARVAFVDACESGALTRTRGGTPVPAIDLTVQDTLDTTGLAILTSAGPLAVARESDQVGGGVFTQALLTGLRGAADTDGNGAVTLEEAYTHAFEQTVQSTARAGHGVQRPEYERALSGAGELVLTRLSSRAAALVLPEELEGVYTVVSVGSGQIVARIDKRPGDRKRVSLPSGRYVVRKVRKSDVLVAELDLAWGGDRWLDESEMTEVPLGDPLSRGAGGFDHPHRLLVGIGAMSALIPESGAGPALSAGLRIGGVRRLGVSLEVGISHGRNDLGSARTLLSSAHAGGGLFGRFSLARLDLTLGVQLLAVHAYQSVHFELYDASTVWEERRQWTAALATHGDAHLPLTGVLGLFAGVELRLTPVSYDEALHLRPSATARAGLMFRFGARGRGRLSRGSGAPEPTPSPGGE